MAITHTVALCLLSFLLGCFFSKQDNNNNCSSSPLLPVATTRSTSSIVDYVDEFELASSFEESNTKKQLEFADGVDDAHAEKEDVTFLSNNLESLVSYYLSSPEYQSLQLGRSNNGEVTVHLSSFYNDSSPDLLAEVVMDPNSAADAPPNKNQQQRNLGGVGVKRLRKRVKKLDNFRDILEELPKEFEKTLLEPLGVELEDITDTLKSLENVAKQLPIDVDDVMALNEDGTRAARAAASSQKSGKGGKGSRRRTRGQRARALKINPQQGQHRELQGSVDMDVFNEMMEELRSLLDDEMFDISGYAESVEGVVDKIRDLVVDAEGLLDMVSSFKP